MQLDLEISESKCCHKNTGSPIVNVQNGHTLAESYGIEDWEGLLR